MTIRTVPFNVGYDLSHIVVIPPDPAMTTIVDAGPVRIGVEYRVLEPAGRGLSLHVFAADTGLEHLRFDAFDAEPHYHYLIPGVSNIVVGFDAAAHGDDMFAWALERLRNRLGPMLLQAGVPALAEQVGAGLSVEAFADVQRVVAQLQGGDPSQYGSTAIPQPEHGKP